MVNPKQKQTMEDGYNKFVVRQEGCWDWKGCAPKNPGYGQFRYQMKLERAHRASWILYFGEIPKGMLVLHKCDNRKCSNPDHLFLGTTLDNIKDMIAKNRHPYLNKPGELNHRSKLKKETVMNIVEDIKNQLPNYMIAKKYNITQQHVNHIKNQGLWGVL